VGTTEAAIERREGVIVEWSRSPQAQYYNARPYVTDRVPLQVSVSKIEDAGDHKFRMTLDWNASGPIPEGYRILVHFTDAKGDILFQGDHAGPSPSETWRGAFQTTTVVNVPASIAAGQKFEMRVGLYGPRGPRAQLAGPSDEARRKRLAAMEWTGSVASWKPIDAAPDPFLTRFNMQAKPIPFEGITTAGALRITKESGATLITPLPGGGAFDIHVPQSVRMIVGIKEDGSLKSLSTGSPIQRDPSVFAYKLQ
jgi:hypothetical protein